MLLIGGNYRFFVFFFFEAKGVGPVMMHSTSNDLEMMMYTNGGPQRKFVHWEFGGWNGVQGGGGELAGQFNMLINC